MQGCITTPHKETHVNTSERASLARARLTLIHTAVPLEGPAEHVRNALQILRFSLDHDEPLIGNGCPGIAVPITSLARIQALLETTLERLTEKDEPDYRSPVQCSACQGTCHCSRSGAEAGP